MSTFFRVAVENVGELWPQVEPLVTQGLRGIPTHDAEDVRKLIYAHECHLWVQVDMPVVEAIVVTQFKAYPKGVALLAWIISALPEPGFETEETLWALSAWARSHNCKWLEASGRHGWVRRIPQAVVEGLIMRVHLQ